MPKIIVSIPTYNEIEAALEKEGYKIGQNVNQLTIEKGTELQRPIDYRLVTIRRDCVVEAAKIWFRMEEDKKYSGAENNFIDVVDQIYQYVLNNVKP